MSVDDGSTEPLRPNIFLVLAKKLTSVEAETSGVRQVVEVVIASHFLDVVLGRDWTHRKLLSQARYDEWMQNRLKSDGTSGIVRAHRVVRLANALFTLLHFSVSGFEILRKRFHVRPTKPCFIEAEIASLLTVNGFKVEIVGESGVRGKDFDLTATRDGIALSIEVTGKEGLQFSSKTIGNTLKGKRTQMPDSRPAILYMHVPASWMQDRAKAQFIFNQAFNDFFGKSHRINGVFLVWEDVVPFPGGGTSEMNLWPCYNNHPIHPFNKWDLLDLRTDSDNNQIFAFSFYDWLKGIQAKYVVTG